MAKQDHWNRVAQQELRNGQGAQNTHGWNSRDAEMYRAARAQQEAKQNKRS
ncbi:MAG: hypothetical protein ACTS22_07450 [Phycisphaerales bacterium]